MNTTEIDLLVHYELIDRVAVLTVANPPVNALSQRVRAGLVQSVENFEKDDAADIAVIVGAGKLFIGGADIKEFGKPPQPPSLPDVILTIEACAKPVVAAIHGNALGGGLEVALGAHYRLAAASAKLGLPEVKLGLMPGAGGTQRLPRLTGVDVALSMITTGQPVVAAQALDSGLVDRVVADINDADEVRKAGIAYARELLESGATPRSVGALPQPSATQEFIDTWRSRLTRTARGEVAPLTALDAVEIATQTDITTGLAEERRLFLQLMETPQRSGLIHAFFAERSVGRLPDLDGVTPREIAHVGVIGGGTMGAGIATSALLAGFRVVLVEQDSDAGSRARATVAGYLAAAVKRGKLESTRSDTLLAESFATAIDIEALASVDLVIEAVYENLELKQSIFANLDKVMRKGAILATNTSYLDINVIAASTTRPADVIGLHYFSPAHIMKLLEIVVADATAPDVVASAMALAKRLGKTAVRAGVCDGFIGNRILARYRAAADHMVLDGASPYQIDAAIKAFGFAMGPYEVSDLAGLDIGHATRQRKAATRHARDRVPSFADALFEAGRLGQKSGSGYYVYEAGSRQGKPDSLVEDIVIASREAAGITPRQFTDEEIVRRYMAAMIDEGARVVDEGIAQRPLDIDVTFVHGYGFPRWRGGPMKYADTYGLAAVLSDIREFATTDDHFWQPAPLLERLVAEGNSFDTLNSSGKHNA